jgi:hypothetical protein
MKEFSKAIHLGIDAERMVSRECRVYGFSQTTEWHRLSFYHTEESRFLNTR